MRLYSASHWRSALDFLSYYKYQTVLGYSPVQQVNLMLKSVRLDEVVFPLLSSTFAI